MNTNGHQERILPGGADPLAGWLITQQMVATVPPARARHKPVCILTEVLASVGVPVPYKDGANGERIIDAVLLLQTAEMSVGIEHDSALRYLDRGVK